ncbi:MAG: hypothetical protein IT537_03060 [Hyphomicrobiales bacterium]|nr:hypothetical protein [Hyphomicrobiales bacterium]
MTARPAIHSSMSDAEVDRILRREHERARRLEPEFIANQHRVERQRSLMAMLHDSRAKDRLMEGMLARARWLMEHSATVPELAELALELLEFLPSSMADALLREFGEDD